MKITFDKEADAAYIYLTEIAKGEVARTVSLNESVYIDLDKKGRMLGIDILSASRNLPASAIRSAVIIG